MGGGKLGLQRGNAVAQGADRLLEFEYALDALVTAGRAPAQLGAARPHVPRVGEADR